MDTPESLFFEKGAMGGYDPHIIKVLGDGNCFFHAICRAYFEPYITGKLNGKVISRKDIVTKLRKDISLSLDTVVNDKGLTLYESLGNGEILKLGKMATEFSLEAMKKHLDSTEQCGDEILELVSTVLDKNIFLIDLENQDVYVTTDIEKLYKENRSCVVLLYNMEDHYDTCAISHNGNFITHFKFDNPFIQFLYNRLKEKKGLE